MRRKPADPWGDTFGGDGGAWLDDPLGGGGIELPDSGVSLPELPALP